MQTKLPPTPWGQLPPRMRVLFIACSSQHGHWLEEAFASDSATEVVIEEVIGIAAGLTRLRDVCFDTVLIVHDPGELDALEVLDAIRTGSSDQQPIIVLGRLPAREMTSVCFESGADAYVCLDTTTTRSLIWHVARAAERTRLIDDNRRLRRTSQNQLQLEHDEAERLLDQQRALVKTIKASSEDDNALELDRINVLFDDNWEPDAELLSHYRELLKTYVIMGSGSLAKELERLTQFLVESDLSARQAVQLHLLVLDETVRELNARSARHVMNRAGLLSMEVLMNMADGYRQRSPSPDVTHEAVFVDQDPAEAA